MKHPPNDFTNPLHPPVEFAIRYRPLDRWGTRTAAFYLGDRVLTTQSRDSRPSRLFAAALLVQRQQAAQDDFVLPLRGVIIPAVGYGSIFGDGNLVEADICQHCLKEVQGKYLRVTEDDPFDPKHKPNAKADKAYQEHQLQQILATENFLKNFREAIQNQQQ